MFRIAKANHALRLQPFKKHSKGAVVQVAREFTSNEFRNIEDDGYVNTKKSSFGKLISRFAKFQDAPRKPGSLILIRHGESEWNHKKLFTGWVDVDLSERGCREIEHAARLLLERGYRIDIAYTSMLKRAIRSSWIILNELNQIYRPMIKSWRLNERMYGALEGHSKPGLAKSYGEQQVQRWRSGLNDRPPEMTKDHLYYHGNEAKYSHLDPKEIPLTESLQDTIDRTIPLWNSQILPDLQAGRNVLICAHRNSIRGIIKHIDNLSTEEIQKVGIPNGIPLVYKFDHKMVPIPNKEAAAPLSGIWLEKQGQLRAALEREKELAESIAGYTGTASSAPSTNPTDSHATSVNNLSVTLSMARTGLNTIANNNNAGLLKSLAKLKEQRLLFEDTPTSGHGGSTKIDNHNEGVHLQPLSRSSSGGSGSSTEGYLSSNYTYNDLAETEGGGGDILSKAELYVDDKLVASPVAAATPAVDSQSSAASTSSTNAAISGAVNASAAATVTTDAAAAASTEEDPSDDILKRPLLVIIRHGKTAHNQLGLFTGWEDAPLTDAGREEALHAGKLLKAHGAKIDVVYTSWLSRAIETAWIVMNELDVLWLPIVKTWRLNERMYGALTGLSKKMIQQIYGDAQFKKWRRGFNEPPPPISSFSSAYPGNDKRYVQYVQDLDISYFETAIRSLAHGKLEVHYNFPKSESLKDCMERTVPYFLKVIGPDSITPGKNVMISSSENAIRGLLMHLCDIPEDKIHAVEIPTGLPMLYDFKTKRIRLLDDKQEHTMLKRYNFGHDPDLLFKRTIKPGAPTGVDNADLSEVIIRSKGVVIKYDEENRIKLD